MGAVEEVQSRCVEAMQGGGGCIMAKMCHGQECADRVKGYILQWMGKSERRREGRKEEINIIYEFFTLGIETRPMYLILSLHQTCMTKG